MYDDKADWYYSFVRKDIAPLLPQNGGSVLEIGCGGGGTLAWLKEAGYATWIAGIELCPRAAAVAAPRLDKLLEGDVDSQLAYFSPNSLDLILCLDVLEHLTDPWRTLHQLQSLLRPGGQLIVSLPNIRHYSVVLPLLLRGRWQYTDAGIMDRTHLRFFTRSAAHEMLHHAGLNITDERPTYAWGTWDRWKDFATAGLLRELLAFQYLICATRPTLHNVPQPVLA